MGRGLKRGLLIAGILGSAVAVAAAMFALRSEPPKKEPEERAMLVEVMTLETMSADFEVQSQGTVRPRTETVLSAEVSGTITSVSPKFIAGGVFEAGETLLRIDPTNYRVAVDQAKALVEQREIEHEGAKRLRTQGYRAEADYAQAKAALATAKAELVRAGRNLDRTYIRVPYDGMVRRKNADLGQFVSPGTQLGVVFATDAAEVRLSLTDLDLAFVDLPAPGAFDESEGGAGPTVVLSARQKGRYTEWPARIVRSEGIVDEQSRVTYAVARIEDPYALRSDREPLPMGSFVSARIEGSSVEDIIRAPRSALRGSDQLVFVDDENRIRLRTVQIVRSDADFVYLSGGAQPGDRIVVTAMERAVNGMKVRIDSEKVAAGERAAVNSGAQ